MYITLASLGSLTATSTRPDTTVVPVQIGAGPMGLQVCEPSAPDAANAPASNINSIRATVAFLIFFRSSLIPVSVRLKISIHGYFDSCARRARTDCCQNQFRSKTKITKSGDFTYGNGVLCARL